MKMDDRIGEARLLYERAVFGGDVSAPDLADRHLDAVEADLALARGRIAHARFLKEQTEDPNELGLFERAAALYQALGDVRGEAESLFWIGTVHQIVRNDNDSARPIFERSLELATTVDDRLTMSYALRHLGIAEHTVGRLEAAKDLLEESVRLRREIGFLPGVAANLIGLVYVADAQGRGADVMALLDEADEAAAASGAQGIIKQVEEARSGLLGSTP